MLFKQREVEMVVKVEEDHDQPGTKRKFEAVYGQEESGSNNNKIPRRFSKEAKVDEESLVPQSALKSKKDPKYEVCVWESLVPQVP